jgi:hypothetical protein
MISACHRIVSGIPVAHYQQIRDAWGGVRIPDGR